MTTGEEIFMFPLQKQPCTVTRALNLAECPPEQVPHDPYDYPFYYDAVYFPSLHAGSFQDVESVCSWLSTGMERHWSRCDDCNRRSEPTACVVDYSSGRFAFRHLSGTVSLSISEIESSRFTFCRVSRRIGHEQASYTLDPLKIEGTLSRNPYWFYFSDDRYETSLIELPNPVLSQSVESFTGSPIRRPRKQDLIRSLITDFLRRRTEFIALTDSELEMRLAPVIRTSYAHRLHTLVHYFECVYGPEVALALRTSEGPLHALKSEWSISDMSATSPAWFMDSFEDMNCRLKHLSKEAILGSLRGIPTRSRPVYNFCTVRSCSSALLEHLRQRVSSLFSLEVRDFLDIYFALVPFHSPPRNVRGMMIEEILLKEYGPTVIQCLAQRTPSKSAKQKTQRYEKKLESQRQATEWEEEISRSWPQVVDDRIVFECLEDYRRGTIWQPPSVCAVCGLERHDTDDVDIPTTGELPFDVHLLQNSNAWIADPEIFQYGIDVLDGAMLDGRGIKDRTENGLQLQICTECRSGLKKGKVPRLALANHLYRGTLPDEFKDLTWVEEMVCAKYRNTAHVARIYQSSDPSQPKVFYGNTCAHDMNVVSTASVLPRTPEDVNGMLSVVFIGPGKFNANNLGPMYRIRKRKVWRFLVWLKTNNRLYADIMLDESIMDRYPDDGPLPDLNEGIIHDNTLDVERVFADETAGFSEHPADLVRCDRTTDCPEIFLEKMGVSDPEGAKLSGRTFTSSALKNLIPSSSSAPLPDLILHRSSAAVPEYKNPDLMPGMFPTLFPLGIGGFEDPARRTCLSFEAQANALLDVPDRCFRYHHSYIFVALNIIQRRAAHLQTYFTVKKSKFDAVAKQLTSVSPAVLRSLADHLQREGRLNTLSDDEQNAMKLLKQVNTISSRIPGSQASKMFVRNEIRSYFSEFGLPHLYCTFNPSATHSPIFQVMFGDQTVDLSSRFPQLVPSAERARRIAKDPVAAADFFEFCVTCIFKYLFGWDYNTRKLTRRGGILGHLRAFYGSSELTDRGAFHGHFLIWLLGGCNPQEIHRRLKEDPDFEKRFFEFLEDAIHHHLPEVEVVTHKDSEPRVERPPEAPSCDIPPEKLREWKIFMDSEIKRLGEALQRHTCRPVCHKYGNADKCRFLFPHEFVPSSHFDPETNSIILKCLDEMVNYFNRYILVYCRHNHDIKCILSGRAAKAAMFYITDYITKMDVKTYELLSLLSRAVSKMPNPSEGTPKERAKLLLHKCLAQFSRQQQIHAQQAARYLRGHGDSISSHNTTPMMSGLLTEHVRTFYKIADDGSSDALSEDDADVEQIAMRIQTDHNGSLICKNQVVDYWYRAESLLDMNFYEFARCVSLEKITKTIKAPTDEGFCLGTLIRHELKDGHPLQDTHCLLEHTNELRGDCQRQLVPMVVGSFIPRTNTGRQWQLFALAHFKPFSCSKPLITPGQTIEQAYDSFQFSKRSLYVMNNWEAIHECQDERDAERMKKRAALTAESMTMTRTLHRTLQGMDDSETDILPGLSGSESDFRYQLAVSVLEQSNWIGTTTTQGPTQVCENVIKSIGVNLPEPTDDMLKFWSSSIKQQEAAITHARRNAQVSVEISVAKTENGLMTSTAMLGADCPESEAIQMTDHGPSLTAEDMITRIGKESGLNETQWVAFRIIARSFIRRYVDDKDRDQEPLRMLLTGPGGTGKTHVVKALQRVMAFYGCAHKIRFLAPTGSAAALINGMTIHKGLGIKIKLNEKGKGNRNPGESGEDYKVVISILNKTQLREEWRNIDVILIDEASLLSAELISEVDSALRFVKEKPDEWFGGIMVIFAGDLYQYPPVGGMPLYSPIAPYACHTDKEIAKRLGRMVWKTINAVVTLTEQQHMKNDPEYGAAVKRLRTRQCTLDDVELFNTCVIKTAANKNGVDMSIPENAGASAIVRTNILREILNLRKAETNCAQEGRELIVCAALDKCPTKPLLKHEREMILNLNLTSAKIQNALPGFIPLYVGMPVVLRMKNISTDLGITNGSQGIIRQLNMSICENGFTYCTCAIVEFPHSNFMLPGLPKGYFPIVPITCTFTTQLTMENGSKITVRISRSQLPFQPGFAVTGQSAQGKTLPSVLTNLHEGGFGAYVAASRPCGRQGLCITEPVTLQQLNKPLPHALVIDAQRLQVIEHNTYVNYGFSKGSLKPVPDPETERNQRGVTFVACFDHDAGAGKSKCKRPRAPPDCASADLTLKSGVSSKNSADGSGTVKKIVTGTAKL